MGTHSAGRCCSGPCSSPLARGSLSTLVVAVVIENTRIRTSGLVAHVLAVVALEVGRVRLLWTLLREMAGVFAARQSSVLVDMGEGREHLLVAGDQALVGAFTLAVTLLSTVVAGLTRLVGAVCLRMTD